MAVSGQLSGESWGLGFGSTGPGPLGCSCGTVLHLPRCSVTAYSSLAILKAEQRSLTRVCFPAMNIRYLETFVTVAKKGSLTAAAQQLGITQSAVSLQIQKLERTFGARLLDRSRQPVTLTAAGEALLSEAERMLESYQVALEGVQKATESVIGRLVLAASTIPGEYILPGLLADFCEQHRGVRLELRIRDTEGVYELLETGAVAFGFVGWRREDLGLSFAPFASDEIALFGPRGVSPGPYELSELARLRLIARESGSGTLTVVKERLGQTLASRLPEPVMVLGSTQAVLQAVRAGAGVGFASRVAAEPYVRAGEIVELAVQDFDCRRTLWVAYEPARATGALREAFLSFIRAQAPAL